jgi:hypothetical protein
VQLNFLSFKVVVDGMGGGERLRLLDEDLHVIETLVQAMYKVKNEVMISDSLTQSTKVVGHALHPVTVVTDAEVALLEYAEPGVELQNSQLTVAEKLSLNHEPCLMCGLRRFLNDLVEFGGEGAKDPCHNDVVQSSSID